MSALPGHMAHAGRKTTPQDGAKRKRHEAWGRGRGGRGEGGREGEREAGRGKEGREGEQKPA